MSQGRGLTVLALLTLAAVVFGGVHGYSMRAGKLVLLEMGMLACIVPLVARGPLRWFLWWALLGLALTYNARSMVTCWRLVLAAGAIQALARGLRAQDWRMLLRVWRWLTVAHTVYMLMQAGGFDPLMRATAAGSAEDVTGFLDNTTLAGAYTALTLPLFGSGWWALWFVPSLLAIFETQSFGAALVGLGLCVVLVCKQIIERQDWGGAAALVIAGAVAAGGAGLMVYDRVEPIQDKLLSERTNRLRVWSTVWRNGTASWRDVFMGSGPGQFRQESATDKSLPYYLQWHTAHNEPLQAFREFGLVGLVLLACAFRRWLVAGFGAHRRAITVTAGLMLSAWLVVSLYTFPAHVAALAFPAILCAAILERQAMLHGAP